jgi:hypothetical protein
MTGSKKSASPDSLAKASPEAAVELSEAALADASGGAVFPSAPAVSSLKLDSSLKIDLNPGLLLPAVKPAG